MTRSVRGSGGRLVHRGHRVENVQKRAIPPLPTRPRLVMAVYPALFIYIIVISKVLELQHSETTQMKDFLKLFKMLTDFF